MRKNGFTESVNAEINLAIRFIAVILQFEYK